MPLTFVRLVKEAMLLAVFWTVESVLHKEDTILFAFSSGGGHNLIFQCLQDKITWIIRKVGFCLRHSVGHYNPFSFSPLNQSGGGLRNKPFSGGLER